MCGTALSSALTNFLNFPTLYNQYFCLIMAECSTALNPNVTGIANAKDEKLTITISGPTPAVSAAAAAGISSLAAFLDPANGTLALFPGSTLQLAASPNFYTPAIEAATRKLLTAGDAGNLGLVEFTAVVLLPEEFALPPPPFEGFRLAPPRRVTKKKTKKKTKRKTLKKKTKGKTKKTKHKKTKQKARKVVKKQSKKHITKKTHKISKKHPPRQKKPKQGNVAHKPKRNQKTAHKRTKKTAKKVGKQRGLLQADSLESHHVRQAQRRLQSFLEAERIRFRFRTRFRQSQNPGCKVQSIWRRYY